MSYADSIQTANRAAGGSPSPWLYDDKLKMGGVKLFADGALGSRGACLKAPYADAPKQSGQCLLTDAQLKNLMSRAARAEEHTSELQSLMRISYAVFCLKKKIKIQYIPTHYSI